MLRHSFYAIALVALLMVPALGKDDFKREGSAAERAKKDPLEGKAAPVLSVKDWMNTGGKALKLSKLKGKVVVLDFWGVWCGPCRESVPHLNKLHEKYKDKGLVIIGVHSKAEAKKMADFAKKNGIKYPIVIDDNDQTRKKYAVDSNPDYYIIDRAGILRIADLSNVELDRAIVAMLAEKAPSKSKKSGD